MVDAGGLLTLAYGKRGASACRTHLDYLLDMWKHLQNPVYKQALWTLVEKVKDEGICFSKVHDSGHAFVQV